MIGRPVLFIYRLTVVSLILFLTGCSSRERDFEIPEGARVISFSGYEWVVASSGDKKAGPGPNYFSDSEENAWVDERGRLHLKITCRDGRWNCARIELARHTGYGKYIFCVSSRPDSLDPQVVWGLYTYMNDQEEIDIEFSRWGIKNNQEAQYAIQPSYITGNKARFRMNLEGDYSTHLFHWTKRWIDFASYHGHGLKLVNESRIIAHWRYYGNHIPPDSDEKLKMNLWLFRGTPPMNGRETEVVIDRVVIK